MARVLVDARFRSGGPGRYAAELIAGLRSSGLVEVDAFTPPPRLADRPFTPWGRRRVAAAARRARVDLLHGLHLELPNVEVPTVVTVHDLTPLEHRASMPSPLRRLEYRRLVRTSLRRATRVIVPSPATATALRSLGVEDERIRIVPLGIGPTFRPLTERERDEARRRFAGGGPYIAAVAAAKAHKNLAGLAGAAEILHDRSRIRVRAAGRPLRAARVGFTGQLSSGELRSFYGGAEVLIVPSHVEGFGLPVLEALACGVPVVCGPGVGALAYLGAGALVVDPAEPDDVAAAVERLLGDADLRRRLVDDGHAAATTLTRATMTERTVAVYRETLERKASRPARHARSAAAANGP